MDGDNGFCGSVLGASEYEAHLAALKPVLLQSRCHTLDRDDMRAHKDICGVGMTSQWQLAVKT